MTTRIDRLHNNYLTPPDPENGPGIYLAEVTINLKAELQSPDDPAFEEALHDAIKDGSYEVTCGPTYDPWETQEHYEQLRAEAHYDFLKEDNYDN